MSKESVYIVLAVVLFGLIPIVPKMVAVRTKVLYALHLNRFANWHDSNRNFLTGMVRVIFAVVGLYMLGLGLGWLG